MEIGNRKVVYSCSLIIPEGETALVEFSIGSWKIKIRINFENDLQTNESTINVGEEMNGESLITFSNWKNPVGTATIKPVVIGQTDTNQQLLMMAASWLIGNVNKLDLHFLLSAKL